MHEKDFKNLIYFSVWRTCAGFRWLPLPYNQCDLLAMAKETYIDFQPNTNIYYSIYINKMRQESEYRRKYLESYERRFGKLFVCWFAIFSK